jgi:hypothetical protein
LRRHGLLRGACHRARIRATRWLAMTVLSEIAKPWQGNDRWKRTIAPRKSGQEPAKTPGLKIS